MSNGGGHDLLVGPGGHTFKHPSSSGGGGGGSVNSVAAGDATITIGGTATDPTVAVGTLTPGSNGVPTLAAADATVTVGGTATARTVAVGTLTPGSNGVPTLAAADATITVGGTATARTVAVGTLTPGSNGVPTLAAGDSTITIGGTATARTAAVAQGAAFTWLGAHIWDSEDSGTATVTSLMALQHRNNAAGTPAAGFGVGLALKLDSSARNLRAAAEVDAVWSTATDLSETAAIVLKTMNAGAAAAEIARFGAGTSTPQFDLAFTSGRCLIDSRFTDQVTLSHQDQTGTTAYALLQNASGATAVNCTSGQTLTLKHAGTTRLTVNTTGIGFFATSPVALQTGPTLNLTNSITAGGVDGTFTNWTDLSVYANDAAAIRNAVYQNARAVKFCSDALRAYGLLT